ncbi:hypothetical protein CC1G_13274 [Coprinopsis cinerea okayama7|uniref:Uncharacterized protein n=1 Tax=Coprinopsis cinerea (strain Okayama-7 / 130 / ATCC MYA-4618 / FGSC 9003) TaxID=240176 RepID=A8PIA6_COPC7|nr:hypothetical protein CC1G_13274 [Coprinopsis cinerea okayama7\|eukprot:XP_001841542.2 hypothetical protein CC1G_13274 [Coprinopsis cinerea okayama7\
MVSPSSPPYLPSPTSPQRPLDPHRIPRAKATEQLEQAVPSVLDSAAAILATLDIDPAAPSTSTSPDAPPVEKTSLDQVAVVAPASSTIFESLGGRTSGFASPLSFRSRSPSPLGNRGAPAPPRQTDLLLGIPSPVASVVSPHTVSSSVISSPSPSTSTSPPVRTVPLSSSPPIAPQIAASISKDSTYSTAPSLVTPTSTSFEPPNDDAVSVSSEAPAPTTLPLAALTTSTTTSLPSPPATSPQSTTSPSNLTPSHPPSPHHVPKKRLSFMSYSDLLSSTPASTLPLSSLTKEANASDPPPHIPSVSGLNLVSAAASVASGSVYGGGSTTASLRGFSMGLGPTGGLTHPGKRDSIALLDNVGGEWEREGMGMGLEERLDRLDVGGSSYAGSPVGGGVGVVSLPAVQGAVAAAGRV